MYDIFGKFGAIRQIRLGNTAETKGTAFVVYEDIYSAKSAVDNMYGFNVAGRYVAVLYYNPERTQKRIDLKKRQEEVDKLKQLHDQPSD